MSERHQPQRLLKLSILYKNFPIQAVRKTSAAEAVETAVNSPPIDKLMSERHQPQRLLKRPNLQVKIAPFSVRKTSAAEAVETLHWHMEKTIQAVRKTSAVEAVDKLYLESQ